MKLPFAVVLYVLRDVATGRRYVGITADLERRIGEHRQRLSKGSQHLGEFEVVLTETYPTYVEAREREKFLKSGAGRRWLDSVLTGTHH